ncbi:GIY-YIG nuclease family protein [Sphingobacteriales bacterium CHB3]|nr:GIY-YIG nuclease family protein [Sphingobacteriales bacterium CHB3]
MFYAYILKSRSRDRFYIGSREDIAQRLETHNGSRAKWTRRYQPWESVYQECYETRGEAMKREQELKSLKNVRRFLARQVKSGL